MALTPDQIDEAARLVAAAPTIRAAAQSLREQFKGITASVVDAMDMRDEIPAWREGSRAIFLAASNGHCWSVTRNPAEASAFVLAE